MSHPRVVVTGVGAVTPLGVGADALFSRWRAGESGITSGVGRADEFDPELLLGRKQARRLDRFTQLAIGAADEALEQAGWGTALPCAPERIGCVLGSANGGGLTTAAGHRALDLDGRDAVSALAVPMAMANCPPAAIAMRHGLKGHSYTISSACASGGHAIGAALRMIQVGDADAVVTGGTDAGLVEMPLASFANMGALSRCGISRPFDARRDGFVPGEGAGVLVLEERERAMARGARILGEISGYGSTSDAYHLTAPQSEGIEAARAISLALADAGLSAEDVDYVNAHGTSTPLNDATETLALKRALGDRAAGIPISSVKSVIGHLLGAAGAVEAIVTLLALGHRTAPPTVGYEEPDAACDLDYVPGVARPLVTRRRGGVPVGISNSFGFGGHNTVLCLQAAA